MKLAKITLGLLAVALLAAAPDSAFAGHGLLDGGCGCATQKGGHVVQKGHVHQKGEIIQKGGVAQKGCGSSCGSCSICLPRVLPTLLHGIDTVLNAVFCCDSCGSAKGCGCATQKGGIVQHGHPFQKGHVVQKGHVTQKGSGCGCGDSHSSPGNPFIDDLQPPPVPNMESDAGFRVRREVGRPASQSVIRPTTSVIKTASSNSREPRPLPAELVSPIEKIREARATQQPTPATVIRTSATTTSGIVVPANPLR